MARATMEAQIEIRPDPMVPGAHWVYILLPGAQAWKRKGYLPPAGKRIR